MQPTGIAQELSQRVSAIQFGAPITHVYNPLSYARAPHAEYLERYARASCEVFLLGMNPGPWGMAQTGVPFGDVCMVRDWIGIEAHVHPPEPEHPKRPVLGFQCPRNEVSGTRLWGWARDRFKTPDNFFDRFFVHNYCPLSFMEESGRNFTPDKLPTKSRKPLEEACDCALRGMVEHLKPQFLIGVGAFAEKRLRAVFPDFEGVTGRILHPSPANPHANRDWVGSAEAALAAMGVDL
jgi:single-strand selective monofunctional uracil DNA glycosylase